MPWVLILAAKKKIPLIGGFWVPLLGTLSSTGSAWGYRGMDLVCSPLRTQLL